MFLAWWIAFVDTDMIRLRSVLENTKPAFTCSKKTMKTLKQCVKSVRS